jgi:hypothetical protein
MMKMPPATAALGSLSLLAFLGAMNKRGYYGSFFGYEGRPARSYNSTGSAARGFARTINDADREQWIDNDEGLYDDYQRWARRNKGGRRAYVRAYRDELDAVIRRVRDGEQPAHYLKYGGPGRYGSNNAGSRAWKDIPKTYRKMSSAELRKLAAAGDRVAAEAYEEKQMAYDAFRERWAREQGG